MPENFISQLFGGVLASLISQPLIWLLFAVAVAASFLRMFSRNIKGRFGEWALSKILHNRCGQECVVLDDVTLVVSEGDTTQVDHIVIAPTGIFVVETKFYKGRIYGKESDKQWTQKIFKSTYKFQNPFRQNYKHVKAIEALLPNVGLANIHSLVVMLGECEWASKDRPAALFTSGWKAADYINDMIASGQKVLDVEEASARLQSLRLQRGLRTNRDHIENLRRNNEV